jgi:hypothetical protein
VLADVPDPRLAGGKLCQLAHTLLFSIAAAGGSRTRPFAAAT